MEKKISGKVTGPLGDQGFKIFWTSVNLIDVNEIHYYDKHSVESALNQFAEKLTEINKNEWVETLFEYEVIE
jgi:hypothetical protein